MDWIEFMVGSFDKEMKNFKDNGDTVSFDGLKIELLFLVVFLS